MARFDRRDWENRTQTAKRSWDVVKTGGVDGIGGTGEARGARVGGIDLAELGLTKRADNVNGDTEVQREDTGKGVDLKDLGFDPAKSDKPGQAPSVEPLAKLQQAQVQMAQMMQQIQQGLGQVMQAVQQMQQSGANPQQLQDVQQQATALGQQAQQLGQQMPQQGGPPPQQGPPPQDPGQGGGGKGGKDEPPPNPMAPPPQGPPPQATGPDGLGMQPQPGPLMLGAEGEGDEPAESMMEPGHEQLPRNLDFDSPQEGDLLDQEPKRLYPSQHPAQAYGPPGHELSALMSYVTGIDTAIKTSEDQASTVSPHISAEKLFSAFTTKFGHEWMDWEPETLVQTWVQEFGQEPDPDIFNKLLGLQALLANTERFWTDYKVFRDVILVLNGVTPVEDGIEDGDTTTPGHITYGVFVAMKLADFSRVGLKEPGPEVKRYVAVKWAMSGLILATFPVKWAQADLSAMVAQNAKSLATVDSGAVARRLGELVDKPLGQATLSPIDPVDLQVAHLLAIRDYVTEMEAGI